MSIYKKMLVIREVDRLVEEGMAHGTEKHIMKTFPALFVGTGSKEEKSGMLGRWRTQCDAQKWRLDPWEKLSEKDRSMKELPDWIRVPLGMCPRALDRSKDGRNMPPCITSRMVSLREKVTTGTEDSHMTAGAIDTKNLKKEAEAMLKVYNDAQEPACIDQGLPVPERKKKVSNRWINRMLSHYGFKRRAPNTYGAYLPYEDERMEKSRKMFHFRRQALFSNHFLKFRLQICETRNNGKTIFLYIYTGS